MPRLFEGRNVFERKEGAKTRCISIIYKNETARDPFSRAAIHHKLLRNGALKSDRVGRHEMESDTRHEEPEAHKELII